MDDNGSVLISKMLPMITRFHKPCTMALAQIEPLSIAIRENIIPTAVPAITKTIMSTILGDSIFKMWRIPKQTDGTTAATALFQRFASKRIINPRKTNSSVIPATKQLLKMARSIILRATPHRAKKSEIR